MSPREAQLGSAAFFLLAPGVVAGLIPALITSWRQGDDASLTLTIIGALIIVPSLVLLIDCFRRFALSGGTPAPIAETPKLVIAGAYKHTRNPMYVAVIGIIFGQALVFANAALIAYTIAVSLAVALFVLYYEEPRLKERFGDAYDDYMHKVPRWRPRFTAWTPDDED